MLGPLQRGIRSFAEAQAESPDFSSGCQMRPIEEGFLNFFFYPVMLYLKYCKILKRRAKVCACSFVLITSPQDSACAEVIWMYPFPSSICEAKHKTKHYHYLDHNTCISHISSSPQSNKRAICFQCWSKSDIARWQRRDFFMVYEKGQNLQVINKKPDNFQVFLRCYNVIGIQSNAFSLIPCLGEKSRYTHFWSDSSVIL